MSDGGELAIVLVGLMLSGVSACVGSPSGDDTSAVAGSGGEMRGGGGENGNGGREPVNAPFGTPCLSSVNSCVSGDCVFEEDCASGKCTGYGTHTSQTSFCAGPASCTTDAECGMRTTVTGTEVSNACVEAAILDVRFCVPGCNTDEDCSMYGMSGFFKCNTGEYEPSLSGNDLYCQPAY